MSWFLYAVSQAAGRLFQKRHGYDRSYNMRLAIGRSMDDSPLPWRRDDNEGWTVLFPSVDKIADGVPLETARSTARAELEHSAQGRMVRVRGGDDGIKFTLSRGFSTSDLYQ